MRGKSRSLGLALAAALALLPAILGATEGEARTWTTDEIRARLHPPYTSTASGGSPAWTAPQRLMLPSPAELRTITIRDRDFVIHRSATRGAVTQEAMRADGFASYGKPDESLLFLGSGGGGLRSRERLVIENCTFDMDFQVGDFAAWDAGRCAIRVDGYSEVSIRNCVFLSRATIDQETRRCTASIVAYDCQQVQIEDCAFAGRSTGWRGHILVFCCGPTAIRNVEIRGIRQGDRWACGGGIWVASGLGEGKIGVLHEDDPDLMIYPPGPLLIENAWIHDQTGKENADGIYIQSVQPFLVRNCRLANWRDDALIDVGFRDGPGHAWKGQPLAGQGGIGVVERCAFERGQVNSFVKNSVGAGAGIVFRDNLLHDVWAMPYISDGGTWYFTGNTFADLSGPAISGDDGRGGGWEPGALKNGSRMVFANNLFRLRKGERIPSLIRAKRASALREGLIMDGNAYDLADGAIAAWLVDDAGQAGCPSLDDWRRATGSDTHSVMAAGLEAFSADAPPAPSLPGGLTMRFGPSAPGLSGPVGVSDPALKAKADAQFGAFERAYAAANLSIEAEDMRIGTTSPQLSERIDRRASFGGGAARIIGSPEQGASIRLVFTIASPLRCHAQLVLAKSSRGACAASLDGIRINPKQAFSLSAGEHLLDLEVTVAPALLVFDRLRLISAPTLSDPEAHDGD